MFLPYVGGTAEKLWCILRFHKMGLAFYTATLFLNYFLNRKIQKLQKLKTISFIKLTYITAQQFSSVNLQRSLEQRSDEHERSFKNCDWDKN